MNTDPRPPSPRPRGDGGPGALIYERLREERARRDYAAHTGGPGVGRHRLIGHDDRTEELPRMADHYDTDGDGLADHDTRAVCDGENRTDPDSWADPDILDEPWREPAFIEPAAPGTSILGDADLED